MISRLHLSAILFVAASVWALALMLAGIDVTAAWFKPFSVVVVVLMMLLAVVDRWLWRVKWLRPWLFNMPLLHGTWRVVMQPAPAPPEQGSGPAPSPPLAAFMVIRQTFSTISLRLYTAESRSETLSARVVRCDDGTCNIAAVYHNTPRLQVRDRSPLHHGALLLSVHGDLPQTLSGEYWTDRRTRGDLVLSDRSERIVHSFEDAVTLAGGPPTITVGVDAPL